MKVDIVIGANYGDEGKGLFTEFLSQSPDNSIVVLVNGGSQRGHTVNDPTYGKHVFHHFGSGTLAGVPTYFAKSYLINPMQLNPFSVAEFITRLAARKRYAELVTTPFFPRACLPASN